MRLPDQRGAELLDAAYSAFAHVFAVAAAIRAVVALAVAIVAAVLLPLVRVGTEFDQ